MIRPLRSSSLDPNLLPVEESLFHLANGYLGIRGYFGEYEKRQYEKRPSVRGTYINAFYENVEMRYPEAHIGFPLQGERMVALPDAKRLDIQIDGEHVSPLGARVKNYTRELVLASGKSRYAYDYETADGSHVSVEIKDLLSFTKKELFVQQVILTAKDRPLSIQFSAAIDGNNENQTGGDDPRLASAAVDLLEGFQTDEKEKALYLTAKTPVSGLSLAIAMRWQVDHSAAATVQEKKPQKHEKEIAQPFTVELPAGESIRFTRFVAYADSRREADPLEHALHLTAEALEQGWETIAREQEAFVQAFWLQHRVEVKGNEDASAALDFAVYNLLQSASGDGISLIAAKGLSGEGYEGHYFWDFEIYLFPFYLWTWPERAKKLLDYRAHTLGRAKNNAHVLGYEKGAQYAWRTITGPECSGYFPSGSAQVHINADIAHAFYQYYLVTGDLDYLAEKGVDVLIETARTWLELGSFKDGKFQLFGVTGPDEYTCLIDNNYFTNRSAKENLLAALDVVKALKLAGKTDALTRTGLTDEELFAFTDAAYDMYLPHAETLGIDAQDDGFLARPVWDFENTPEDHYPLLLYYHPSKLYRYQVLKQPDTSLAHFLYEPDLKDPVATRSRHYYEAITTHDSSLSPCIYGAMAARAGEMEKAKRYFRMTSHIDLKNLQGNTADGLHLGNIGGTWLFVIRGYAGLTLNQGKLSLDPKLPTGWEGYRFSVTYRGARLEVDVKKTKTLLTWHGDLPLEIEYRGREIRLQPKEKTDVYHHLGIIFDLDGVLVHTDHYHYQAWKEMADSQGIYFDKQINQRLRGVSRMDSLDIILEQANRPFSNKERVGLATKKNVRYRELLATLSKKDLAKDHRARLKKLKDLGYKLAIGSSSKNASFIVDRLGLTDLIDHIADGNEISRSKPDPEVFLLAAKKMDLPPEACVVIEDAAAGLEAAVAGRFTAAGFGAAAKDELAELSFDNLDQLFDWFLDEAKGD